MELHSCAPKDQTLPEQICQVFRGEDIFVSSGVNLGDGLAGPYDVCLGDVYELDRNAQPCRLVLSRDSAAQVISRTSEAGTPGEIISLSTRLTLLAPDGERVELMILKQGRSDEVLVLPLSPIGAQIEYTLVKTEDAPQEAALTDLLCISFARGTMITMADGRQCPIETLVAGDRALTRDHGAQPVRWLGQATMRAVGAFAPVVITAGSLGNEGDLVVSQHHRLFIYQRHRRSGIDRAELLIQAKHLVDDNAVFLREGGFVDYFCLVFDQHEIIYAEGIPAESLMVNEATVSHLPPEMADDVRSLFPGLSQGQHFGFEAGRQILEKIAPSELYQSAH